MPFFIGAAASHRAAFGGVGRHADVVDGQGDESEVGHEVAVVIHIKGVAGIRRYHDAVFGPVVEGVSAVGRGRDSAALSFLIGAATGDGATFRWVGYYGNGEGGQQRL